MKIKFFFVISIFISLYYPSDSFAGAWTQELGGRQIITSVSYYKTSYAFDQQGKRKKTNDFNKAANNHYWEYGIYDGTTLGFLTELQYLNSSIENQKINTTGISDTGIFLRQRLAQTENWIISVQPELKAPPYYYKNNSLLSADTHGSSSLSLLIGSNMTLFGKPSYISTEAGYRHYFLKSHDQVYYSATLGLSLNDNWEIQPQFESTKIHSSKKVSNFASTILENNAYNLNKAQISVIYKLNNHTKLQLGEFNHISGKNTGAGNGVIVALWTNF